MGRWELGQENSLDKLGYSLLKQRERKDGNL